MGDEGFLLTTDNVREYLAGRALVQGAEEISVRELGGGVSNIVLLIEWPRIPGRGWVVKQSLGKLRVKDDWRSERSRIIREAEAIKALGPILGPASVPQVVHLDPENFLFVMTAAPAGSLTWKELLLGRRADAEVARSAALLLARVINASDIDPRVGSPSPIARCSTSFASIPTTSPRQHDIPSCERSLRVSSQRPPRFKPLSFTVTTVRRTC